MISIDRKDAPEMTDAEFRMIGELLRERCGLHFGPESRFLLEKRLGRRLRELELTSFSAYHYLVRNASSGDSEFARLIDELTTNETYFFRERSQLRALMSEILPEVRLERAQRDAPVNIWCAGCSSGEEPYTIVIMAMEAGFTPGVDLHVYASDISQRMLRKARQGVYREASFRETEPAMREKYFSEKDGLWRISDDVKRHVEPQRRGVADGQQGRVFGDEAEVLFRLGQYVISCAEDNPCTNSIASRRISVQKRVPVRNHGLRYN